MTSSEKPDGTQTQSLHLDYELAHPPEKLWRALTDPDLLAEWLLPVVDFGLEPGQKFTFHTEPKPGWDGVVQCRLLEVDEPRKISWRWVVGDIDTVVTFTLTPSDTGTHLSIVQTGFKPDQKQNLGGARYGWKMMSGRLIELLDELP